MTSTPQRRVPLPLSNVPLPEDTDGVAVEIDSVCRQEQNNYAVIGSLTPRRYRTSSYTPTSDVDPQSQETYDAWKLRVFQPKRPQDVSSPPPPHVAAIAASATSSIPSPPPSDTYRGKKLYFQLQRLFEAISSTGEPCENRPALFAFSLACHERNPMIRWIPDTQLHRNIQKRQDQLSTAQQVVRDRAEKLLVEQRPVLTEKQRLEAQWAASRDEASMGTLADNNHLLDLERKAALEEERRQHQEAEKKRIGEERRAQAREAALQRKAERDRKLQEVLDKDEETRLDMEAVLRVREKMNAERDKAMTLSHIQDAHAS
ncbi:Hypothetical protein, putative [Bodo saltans]|uniref:Uncharacterized protein n=1 Tax=Bodo saltans TaxID=75058 RepID=A0A0S4KHM2_BODSA|nr:Hypothetical protein, putative [Bodo saltans]|eukprot:CUI14438.1 Hypothetical protein, putative [Bodo saltans]